MRKKVTGTLGFSEEKFDMSKKNLPLRRRNSDSEIIGYRLPVFHGTGKKVYVDFYAYDPMRGELRRKKIHLDHISTKVAQRRHAHVLISTLTEKLLSGWNPWCDAATSRGFTPIDTIIEKYKEYVGRTGRKKTQQCYNSRCNILEEYNSTRLQPIRYAYQYDKAFVIDFLDWVLLDRDSGARTCNNYKGWCSAFGEFMVQRKYIDSNPAEGIPKLPEDSKFRQPLTEQMMRKLHRHLKQEDPHFLLAVMMEYFTFIRPTELSNLRLRDIEIKEQRVFISKEFSKNKRDGYVGLNETIIRTMIDLDTFRSPGDWYLFGKGFVPNPEKAGPDQFNKRWVRMRKKLGWGKEYQFYSLKDTGIRDLANSEGIVIARDQARHTDVSTTNRYLGVEKSVHAETKSFKGAFEENQNL